MAQENKAPDEFLKVSEIVKMLGRAVDRPFDDR